MENKENVPGMFKKQGVWVFNSGAPLRASTVEKILRIVRLERERRVIGGRPRDVFTRNVSGPKR